MFKANLLYKSFEAMQYESTTVEWQWRRRRRSTTRQCLSLTFNFVSNPYKCKVVAHFFVTVHMIIIKEEAKKKMIYKRESSKYYSNKKWTHRYILCSVCTLHKYIHLDKVNTKCKMYSLMQNFITLFILKYKVEESCSWH